MKRRICALALCLMVIVGGTGLRPSPAEGGGWTALSGPYGGSIAALALSPAYAEDHTLYTGRRSGGVYHSGDRGASWHPVSPRWVVVDLSISPDYASDGTLFAVTGLPTTGFEVYRTTDGAESWDEVTPSWSQPPNSPRLVVSPDYASDDLVYLLGDPVTYVSHDGGATFSPAGGWFDGRAVVDLAFSPDYGADATLFAVVEGSALYRSTDGGATWFSTGLAGDLGAVALSPAYATDTILFALSRATGILYRSTDGGTDWVALPVAVDPAGEHTLALSPTFGSDGVVVIASSADPGPYHSSDGGDTWQPVGWSGGIHFGFVGGSVVDVALSGQGLVNDAFAATPAGLYRSGDGGIHWYQANEGLGRLAVRALDAAPGDPELLLAGTGYFHERLNGAPHAYSGDLQRSDDGGRTWKVVSGALRRVNDVTFSPAFAADETAFAATGAVDAKEPAGGGLYRSTDGALTWSPVLTDAIFHAVALSPAYDADATLWVASRHPDGNQLHRSTDGGASWEALPYWWAITTLAPSPNYPVDGVLFAGTATAGLLHSDDGGDSWSEVIPGVEVTALALSPAYAADRTLLAAVRPSPAGSVEVRRSTDGGASWEVVRDEMAGDVTVLSYAVDGGLLAGTRSGAVYRSTDGGESWERVGSGPEGEVYALEGAPAGSMTLLAGTAAGAWSYYVPQGADEPGFWHTSGPRGGSADALAVSPGFPQDGVVLAGEHRMGRYGDQSGVGIVRSSDGGWSWQKIDEGTVGYAYASAVHAYAFSPEFEVDGTVFAATWGGLFQSTDGGTTWSLNEALGEAPGGSVTSVALAPDYPSSGHLLAGRGWGGLLVSDDGGLSWTTVTSVTGTSSVAYSPDFAADGVAFAGGTGLYRTADRGMTWSEVLTEGVASLAVSPAYATDATLFAGSEELLISHDGGTSWISATVAPGAPWINALVLSPAYAADATLFAGTSQGLHRSTDGGLTWSEVISYPGSSVLSLAISPAWPAQPVLLVGTAEGVYRTEDGGATWALTQGFVPLGTAVLKRGPSTLLAGTRGHGVYESADGGATWQPRGLHYAYVMDLGPSPVYPTDGTLFATVVAGAGFGVYRSTDGGATWEFLRSSGYGGYLALAPDFVTSRTLFLTGEGGEVLRSPDAGDTWERVGEWPSGRSPSARLVALPPDFPVDGTIFTGGTGFWYLPPGWTTWQEGAGLPEGLYVQDLTVSTDYAVDGTLLMAASWSEGLGGAMHYGVFRSEDGGATWSPSGVGLPDTPFRGVVFDGGEGAYLVSQGALYRSRDGGLGWTEVGAPATVPPAPGRPPENPLLLDVAPGDTWGAHVASDAGVWRYDTFLVETVVNGGYEGDEGWVLPGTPVPAAYSDVVAYAGVRSMRVGIVNGANAYTYSSARQTIEIPPAARATLRCRVYPVTGADRVAAAAALRPERALEGAEVAWAEGDAQYLLLFDEGGGRRELFWLLSNERSWQRHTFDLTAYAGTTVTLHLGAYNDGVGGRTAMYVDEVSLLVDYATGRAYLPLILRK